MAQLQTVTPFQADTASELPVGVQLAWRLRALITAGRLAPGERMPSVRTMAEWAEVNVNTVRAVYARLEDEGLIETRHGRGSYVAAGAHGSAEVERIAAEAIDAAREAGVDPRDVAITALISSALPEALELPIPAEDDPEEPDLGELAKELDLDESWLEVDEGAARRELRRQIGRIEAELASYTPRHRAPLRPAAPESQRAANRRRRGARRDPGRAARPARRGAPGRRRARQPRASRARGPRRDGRGPRRPPLGGDLSDRDRRGGLHDLARRPRWGRSGR